MLNYRLFLDSWIKCLKRIRRFFFDIIIIVYEGKKNFLIRCDLYVERYYCYNNGVCSYIFLLELKICRWVCKMCSFKFILFIVWVLNIGSFICMYMMFW